MDISSTSWFSELEMDDTIYMDKCDIMDSFDEELAAILEEDIQNTLSPENNSLSCTTNFNASSFLDAPQVDGQSQAIQYMPSNYDSSTIHNMPNFDQNSSAPVIFNFENSSVQENHHQVNLGNLNPENDQVSEVLVFQGSVMNLDEANKSAPTSKKSIGRIRPPSHTYNHIMAERKRREVLSQRFIALSAIVPGLKKMDKTSVLGDTIKYLKQLKERVKILEEQASKQTMESVVLVKKSQLLAEDEGSSDENGGADYGKNLDKLSLPEIEARMCGQSVLLRIHCEKRKGLLVGILDEVEKVNLAVTNTSVSQFGGLTLDITIIAEMEKEFSLTMKELVRNLRSALQRVIEEA